MNFSAFSSFAINISYTVSQRPKQQKQSPRSSLPGLRPATLIKKETLAQVFSYKFRKVSKDTFLQNTSGLNGATKDKLREKICLRLSLKFLQLRWWRRKLCLLYKLSSTLSNLDYGLLVYMYSACWKFRSTLLFRK